MSAVATPPLGNHLRRLQKSWRGMLVAAAAILAGGFGLLATVPDVYVSEGKLFVRLGRENVTLDPTANLGEGPISAVPLSRENELNTVVETARSRVIVEHVVDEVGVDAILRDQYRWWRDWLPSRLDSRERAIGRLSDMIEVAALRKSSVVAVSCKARDPELAKRIVETFVKRFLTYHQGLNRNPEAHAFFEEQVMQSRSKLQRSEADLLAYKQDAGLVAAEMQKRSLLERRTDLSREIGNLEAEIDAGKAAISMLQGQLHDRPEMLLVEQTDGIPNLAADAMREQLFELELQEKQLSAKYAAGHPHLIAVRRQLAEVATIYDKEENSRSQTRKGRSSIYEEAELALSRREVELASLEAEAAVRRPQLADVDAELKRLNEAEAHLVRLERNLDLERAAFVKYSNSLEQARIDDSLEAEQITNIGVVEPPTIDRRPIAPDRPLFATVIMLCAVCCPVGIVLATDGSARGRIAGMRPAEPPAL